MIVSLHKSKICLTCGTRYSDAAQVCWVCSTAEPELMTDPYQVTIGGVTADPYRIARAYEITDPVLFQALKKLLRCGRKHKDCATDVREAITSLERWEAMNAEDSKQKP